MGARSTEREGDVTMSRSEGSQQPPTVTPDGASLAALPAGVTLRRLTTHVDGRGSLVEIFNPVWQWHAEPLVHAYMFTVRPGSIKAWGRHEKTEDRWSVLFGEAMLVLYDDRPDSTTRGLVSEIALSEYHRTILNIPVGIWHGVANLGDVDFVALNLKTTAFDHGRPDKFSLPWDTDEIPYDFGKLRHAAP